MSHSAARLLVLIQPIISLFSGVVGCRFLNSLICSSSVKRNTAPPRFKIQRSFFLLEPVVIFSSRSEDYSAKDGLRVLVSNFSERQKRGRNTWVPARSVLQRPRANIPQYGPRARLVSGYYTDLAHNHVWILINQNVSHLRKSHTRLCELGLYFIGTTIYRRKSNSKWI